VAASSINLANKLGIEAKISGYSYMDNKYYYLEEDCDFSLFLDSLGLDYQNELSKVFIKLIPENYTNNRSPIRSKQNYQYTSPKVSIINQLSIWN
jgi:hypothetical protein